MALSSLCRCAAGDEGADRRDQAVKAEAGDADIGECDDDVGQPRRVPRVPDEETDADAAGQHFGGDDGEPGQADADAQTGEDVGRGGRYHDLDEELERVEPKDAGDVAVVLWDVAHANGGVDDYRPDRGDE